MHKILKMILKAFTLSLIDIQSKVQLMIQNPPSLEA